MSLGDNSRNGYSSKVIASEDDHPSIDAPQDRGGGLVPRTTKKHGLDQRRRIKESTIYIKGMSAREITVTFKEPTVGALGNA
ncbi:MAG: hypothetical protein RPT25_10895 [Cycloclasticus sp.]